MVLRLRNRGVATAYATVKVGGVEPERENAREAARRLKSSALLDYESIFLLGQADIATMFETSNFKAIFELRYPGGDSAAAAMNWVFSVPFEAAEGVQPPKTKPGFRFILHLRLQRSIYAFNKVEEKIVEKLTTMLDAAEHTLRVHVGLGWSDLLLDGTFTAETFNNVVKFIIGVHGLKIRYQYGEEQRYLPVLQRMLTVMGYSGDPPEFANNDHLTFLRAKPGQYDRVEAVVRDFGVAYALDGKADFILVSTDSEPDWLSLQRELGTEKYKYDLRKVETHLMFLPAAEFVGLGELIDVDESFDRPACSCDQDGQPAVNNIDESMKALRERGLLPTEQRYAVDNILFLLATILRDTSICCDARDAVLASYQSLQAILDAIAGAEEERSATSEVAKYARIVDLWRELDDWHRFTENLLRQRTVGSFEEFLGQSDRSVVYSGGVQKFLYLADQVLADFAHRVDPQRPPAFATIYDSVKTILSARAGIVRIPTSKIFSFPLVVPDLWHEVAGTLFYLRLSDEIRKIAPRGEEREFLANAADHYADILVYLHGFRADLRKFFVSLAHSWRMTYPRKASQIVKRQALRQFLLRAYLIFEFDTVRSVSAQASPDAAALLSPNALRTLVDKFQTFVAEHLPPLWRGDDDWRPEKEDWSRLRENVKAVDFSNVQRHMYTEFVKTRIEWTSPDLKPFEAGMIISVDDDNYDWNDAFGEMAYRLASSPDDATHFQTMAALGKSAEIDYHRRQVARRAAAPPPKDHEPDATIPKAVSEKGGTDAQQPPRAGQKIAHRFILGELIGQGVWSVVYAAEDQNIGVGVALKLLRRTVDGVDELLMAKREVGIARRASHPNVCKVYDLHVDRGRVYISMDRIDGKTLAAILKNGPLLNADAIGRSFELLAALDHLHERGIVHRDLKPSNIMIDHDRGLQVTAFGLATVAAGAGRGLFGTLPYMAPEQLRGDPASMASDVCSVGLVLYEIFTGKKLLQGSTKEEFAADYARARAVRPSSVGANVSKTVDDLVFSCLAEKPDDRPTARALRQELQMLFPASHR